MDLPSLWSALKQQIYLGDERFLKRMQEQVDCNEDLREIPRTQRRQLAKPLQYYKTRYQDKKQGMVVAYSTGDYTMKEIAACFNVHYSTVSRAIKKAETGDT